MTYSRWLRLLVSQSLLEMARDPTKPATPVLYLLDQFAFSRQSTLIFVSALSGITIHAFHRPSSSQDCSLFLQPDTLYDIVFSPRHHHVSSEDTILDGQIRPTSKGYDFPAVSSDAARVFKPTSSTFQF
ncbi:hypothetical protein [Rhizobium sp. AN68]|uniref:hypothetical protein n=1 Tax=Rhizobium sp. AN68 TaxID=3035122 RepID=UPI002B26097A|nr:hypothetical protein [Rhizobium sp. AN68]